MRAALAVFSGAFLLFWLQPLIGRLLLPRYGGGSAVWAVTLVFFQTALLLGYAWAHLIVLRLSPRAGRLAHGVLALGALAALPITAPAFTASSPAAGLLLALVVGVGLPAAVLATTAPLVQAWVAQAGGSPWRLYAWSNAGSLLALVAYPFVLEPALGATRQATLWSIGFVVAVAALAAVGAQGWGGLHAATREDPGPAPPRLDRLYWFGLTACSSALLVATTDQLTEDLAATPFLWILPLALFLLSYIFAFGSPRWTRRAVWLPLFGAGLVAQWWALSSGFRASILVQIVAHAGTLFAACMVLHGELVRARPAPARLTGFYLTTALGGAVGGALVSLVAPAVLPIRVELPAALLLAGGLALVGLRRSRAVDPLRGEPAWIWALPVGVLLGLGGLYAREFAHDHRDVMESLRSFYGVLRVRELDADDPRGPARRLLHGRIMHGMEFTDARRGKPNSYYGPRSGVGLLFALRHDEPPRRVAALGLGVGTLSAFQRCGDRLDFFEIDPLVEVLARRYFSYLDPGCTDVRVIIADGRLGLAAAQEPYAIILLDAFSGDAVPTHLLTREAIASALDHLTGDGVIAVNVSNRHLDLRPVVR
ncbi:MAG: fused MFS/spermidine synthase, partial [Myxococcales bacterium]|nr:fused MFS/spermidine synthase [Myxococcales bacterium]